MKHLPVLLALLPFFFSGCKEYLDAEPKLIVMEQEAGSETFNIESNTSWLITTSDSWLSTDPSGGSDNATITLNCTENTEYDERSTTVTISGDGSDPMTLSVRQKAKPGVQMKWVQKAAMPTARSFSNVHACIVDGKIYIIGGANEDFEPLNVVEAYDPATDTWASKAPIQTARWGHIAEAVEGKIYVMGGCPEISGNATSNIEVYDSSTDTWQAKGAMPFAAVGHASCVVDGKIYVMGGRTADPGGDYYNNLEVFDPSLEKWTSLSPMPSPKGYYSASAYDGTIYAIGGAEPGGSGLATTSIFKYDIATDTWSDGLELNQERWSIVSCTAGSYIVCAGGYIGPTDIGQNTVELIHMPTDVVTETTGMLSNKSASGICSLNGKIYVFGGTTTSPPVYGASHKVEEGSFLID